MNTQRVRLGEVLILDCHEVRVEPTRTYPLVGVRSFGKGLFRRPDVLGAEISYTRLYQLKLDQIVLSRLFGWEGAVAQVSEEYSDLFVSPEFPTFTIDVARADPRFVGHFVRWDEFHSGLAAGTRGLGQRRQRVHPETLLELEIPLPQIEEQRRIASRVTGLRSVADNVIQRIAHVSAVTESFSVSATSRHDLDDRARTQSGWRRVPLSDVLDLLSPTVPVEPSTSYTIAGIFSFGRGLIDRGTILGVDTSYSTLQSLSEGDVVVSKLNGWEGAVAVVPAAFDGYCVSPEFPTFRVNRARLIPEYFGGIARSPWFWEALDMNARGSMVRRRRINASEFLQTEIWLPPIEVQAQIARQLQATNTIEKLHLASRTLAEALVPAALNEAFSTLR